MMRKLKKIFLLSAAAVAALAPFILMAGCGSKPEGEEWAKKNLGATQAETLRSDVAAKLGIAEPRGGFVRLPEHGNTPYLPRPYVVFDEYLDPKNPNRTVLAYAPMNMDCGGAAPKGVAVLQKDTRSAGRDRKGRVIQEGFVQITLLDLEANIMTMTTSDKADGARVRAVLNALPQAAP